MTRRVVFDDEDDATSMAGRLRGDGFESSLARERFAGEDDDEDHAWVVLTDAPGHVVELLVEQHGGWLDVDEPPVPNPGSGPGPGPGPAVPLDLPDSPRRVKGHWPAAGPRAGTDPGGPES